MRIAVTGKTYKARQHLKSYGLRWNPGKKAWIGDVERKIVTLIRETVMRQIKNIQLVFEDPQEAKQYFGYPSWICPSCENVLRYEDLDPKFGENQGRCPFCKQICRLELEE